MKATKKPRPSRVPLYVSSNSELFQCSECHKAFVERKRYNQHLKTHVRPFKCDNCSRGFALRSDLTRHVETRHRIAQLRHSCPIDGCSFNATRKDNLNQHVQHQHGTGMLPSPAHDIPRYDMADMQPRLDTSNSGYDIRLEDSKLKPTLGPVLPSVFSAAAADNVSLLKQLSSLGASMHAITDGGCNALHAAARAGKEQATEYLLGLGLPSILNERLRLPVHEAALSRNWNTLRLLIEHREILPEPLRSSYPTACSSDLADLILRSEHHVMIKSWIEYTGPHIIMEKRLLILHRAAQLKNASILGILLSYNISNINEPDSNGYTPIHHAAKNKNPDIIRQILLHPDTHVNMLTRKDRGRGWSALQIAIGNNNLDGFKMLIGDDRLRWDKKWNAPVKELRTCRTFNRLDMWKSLIEHHWADETNNDFPLLSASVRGEDYRVVELLAQGALVLVNNYPNPFHCAIAMGHSNIAKLLLNREKGNLKKANFYENGEINFHGLHIAVSCNDKEIVQALLESNNNFYIYPETIEEALLRDDLKRDSEILKLLLQDARMHWAYISDTGICRLTHAAMACNGTDILEFWRHFSDNASEWQHSIALDVVIRNKRTDLLVLLRNHGVKAFEELSQPRSQGLRRAIGTIESGSSKNFRDRRVHVFYGFTEPRSSKSFGCKKQIVSANANANANANA